jgi:hypothetical protein
MKKLAALSVIALTLASSCGKKNKGDTPYTTDPTVPLVDLDTSPTTPPPHTDPGHPGHPTTPPDTPTRYCNKGVNDKEYPEGVHTSSGSQNGYDFGVGGGCLRLPIREVWAKLLNQKLMVWVDVDESTYLQYSPPEHVSFFFTVNYVVHQIITVDWDMDWYHTVKAGSKDAPVKILVNYKKVKGTSHISYWEGSIILDRVNDHVTSFAMKNQITADQTNAKDAEDAIKDVYGKMQTGAPDWDKLH